MSLNVQQGIFVLKNSIDTVPLYNEEYSRREEKLDVNYQ